MSEKILKSDLQNIESKHSAKYISNFLYDAGLVQNMVSTAVLNLMKDTLTLVTLLSLMFYQNWKLAFLAIIFFPLSFIPIAILGKRIRYLTGDRSDHPSIGRIKDCALTSINTKYTPDGTYMTFDDEEKTMTSYQIDMTFQELEPLTEEDYTTRSLSPNDNQIGF